MYLNILNTSLLVSNYYVDNTNHILNGVHLLNVGCGFVLLPLRCFTGQDISNGITTYIY